jgi:hypothetical protein
MKIWFFAIFGGMGSHWGEPFAHSASLGVFGALTIMLGSSLFSVE